MDGNLIFLIVLAVVMIVLAVVILIKVYSINGALSKADIKYLKEEFQQNRQELTLSIQQNREELSKKMDDLKEKVAEKFMTFQQNLSDNASRGRSELSQTIKDLTEKLERDLTTIRENINKNAKDNQESQKKALEEFGELFYKNIKSFNDLQKEKFKEMNAKQTELVNSTEAKLEKMRETVDEKLHKTLEERLGQSFKLVSERLEAVQKGLGEMQNLATGVGDLKKVLANVKTRGGLGEIQLGNILEQIMTPEQYEPNVKTKQGSNHHVEFAIKLPGKDDNGGQVYLPIDAKFPQEDYIRLQEYYENGDKTGVENAQKSLVRSIKSFAKDIRDKYIDPPYTTDFGIMFLPIEGLYAEVVRLPELVVTLQRDFKIIIAGPTTLVAMLNSLQMGFKTLAIEKRSSEVWKTLGEVKTEFGKFGDVLKNAQKKLTGANQELEKLVGTRTNVMMRKLRDVEALPETHKNVLDETTPNQTDI